MLTLSLITYFILFVGFLIGNALKTEGIIFYTITIVSVICFVFSVSCVIEFFIKNEVNKKR